MNADIQLDPEHEDLPWNRVVEICTISDCPSRQPLCEATEERDTLAEAFANASKPSESPGMDPDDDDLTIFKSISQGPKLRKHIEEASDFLDKVQQGYKKDPLFVKIVTEPERYSSFMYRDGLLYTHNRGKQEVLCIDRKSVV